MSGSFQYSSTSQSTGANSRFRPTTPDPHNPLPQGWEMLYDTQTGWPFFVDHNTRRTTWQDPRRSRPSASSFDSPFGRQSPFGGESVFIGRQHPHDYPDEYYWDERPAQRPTTGSPRLPRGNNGKQSGPRVNWSPNISPRNNHMGASGVDRPRERNIPIEILGEPKTQSPRRYVSTKTHRIGGDPHRQEVEHQHQRFKQQQRSMAEEEGAGGNSYSVDDHTEERSIPIKVEKSSSRTPKQSPRQQTHTETPKSGTASMDANASTRTPENQIIPQLVEIDKIMRDTSVLQQRVDAFQGTKSDKEYLQLEEFLTRNLLKLDNIESNGNEEVRHFRRNTVRSVQNAIELLEQKVSTENVRDAADVGIRKDDKMENVDNVQSCADVASIQGCEFEKNLEKNHDDVVKMEEGNSKDEILLQGEDAHVDLNEDVKQEDTENVESCQNSESRDENSTLNPEDSRVDLVKMEDSDLKVNPEETRIDLVEGKDLDLKAEIVKDNADEVENTDAVIIDEECQITDYTVTNDEVNMKENHVDEVIMSDDNLEVVKQKVESEVGNDIIDSGNIPVEGVGEEKTENIEMVVNYQHTESQDPQHQESDLKEIKECDDIKPEIQDNCQSNHHHDDAADVIQDVEMNEVITKTESA
ncbi:uncharacterized protein LOC144445117 [Glandiceps talaboti]